MDALELPAAVLVGHSGGSYTAQRFALDHPDRTLGLVLIGAFRAFHDNPDALELAHAVLELTDPVDPGFVREFQESCIAQPVPAGFIDAIIAEVPKLPARVWKD
jgi:non-heme chloroperoxidase